MRAKERGVDSETRPLLVKSGPNHFLAVQTFNGVLYLCGPAPSLTYKIRVIEPILGAEEI